MADDFIAPIEPGQGTASQGQRPLGGAPDYRQLQNPAQVRTDLPSSGAAERAAELGRVFKEFSSEAINVSNTLGTQAGAIAGAAAGAGVSVPLLAADCWFDPLQAARLMASRLTKPIL